ncbi:MAG: hypothetical protein ACI83W_002707, partial [Marinoscillum sp.]
RFLEAKAKCTKVHSFNSNLRPIKPAFDKEGITIPFPIRTLDFGIKSGQKLSQMKLESGE